MNQRATDQLFAAIVRSDAAGVRQALGQGADVNANGPSGGETPLMQLRLCRDPAPILRLLLKAGADPARIDLAGRTALHHLTLCRDPAGIEAALAAGVDPEHRDRFGDRAFEFGLNLAEPAVFDRLLQAMAPLGQEDRSRLFLRRLLRGDSEGALALVGEGISLEPLSAGAFPPLYLAAREGEVRVVRALLDAGARIDALFGARETALTVAARSGRGQAVAELLGRGADPDHADAAGQCPLHAAAGSHLAPQPRLGEVVGLLLAVSADPLRRDHRGYWPRALARARGNDELVALLPALAPEPPIDPSAARVAVVELARVGGQRLRWYPNDLVQPFALEEHVQRDEWAGRWLDPAGLAGTLHGSPLQDALAWFVPLLDRQCDGHSISVQEVRETARRALGRVLMEERMPAR